MVKLKNLLIASDYQIVRSLWPECTTCEVGADAGDFAGVGSGLDEGDSAESGFGRANNADSFLIGTPVDGSGIEIKVLIFFGLKKLLFSKLMHHECAFFVDGGNEFTIVAEFGCEDVGLVNEVLERFFSVEGTENDCWPIEVEEMIVGNIEGGEITSFGPWSGRINVCRSEVLVLLLHRNIRM